MGNKCCPLMNYLETSHLEINQKEFTALMMFYIVACVLYCVLKTMNLFHVLRAAIHTHTKKQQKNTSKIDIGLIKLC